MGDLGNRLEVVADRAGAGSLATFVAVSFREDAVRFCSKRKAMLERNAKGLEDCGR
jgi:hypothetical protein